MRLTLVMLPTACTARQIKLDVSLIRFAVLNRVAYQFDSNQLFLAVVCVCMCVYAKCYCCHHWFRQTLKQGIMMCAQIVGCTLSDHHWMGLAVPWVTWISVWWSHISRFLGIYVSRLRRSCQSRAKLCAAVYICLPNDFTYDSDGRNFLSVIWW